jgi:transcriptional regulator GlxA family with amidase domain
MLPALAFHEHNAPRVTDPDDVGEGFASLMPMVSEFYAIGPKDGFAYKKASLKINELHVIALSHTGYRLDREDCRHGELWMPISGCLDASDGERDFQYGVHQACFWTTGRRNVRTLMTSVVGLRFDMETIASTYAHMKMAEPRSEVPHRPSQILDLKANGLDFLALFANTWAQIDLVQGDARTLERLAVDDAFHRLIVGLLHPELVASTETGLAQSAHAHQQLRRLCEILRADFTRPISLTDMERISGLSARVLQYSFQKTYGMRPKQWLRKQRLEAVRALIQNPTSEVKLTALAYDFCFASPSELARQYREEYGELPSQTMRNYRAALSPLFRL